MRPDPRLASAGLRTWWLAVFAAWSMLVCLLAAFGLGGRVAAVEDAGPARPLPAIPAAPAGGLGELAQYAAISRQPVFAEDRQPHPFVLGGVEGDRPGDLRLTGVLITPQLQMATFTTDQGRSLRLRLQGEAVDGWRLLSLAARSATVEGAGGVRTLELQVYDGQGGQPPTALRTAPGIATAPPATVPVAAPSPVPPRTAAAAPPAAVAVPPGAANGTTNAAAPAANAPPAPSEAQLQAIRERIEARRQALRQQNAQNSGGAVAPPPPPPSE